MFRAKAPARLKARWIPTKSPQAHDLAGLVSVWTLTPPRHAADAATSPLIARIGVKVRAFAAVHRHE
jgi:hypothetical protein